MPVQSETRRCRFCGKDFRAYLVGKKPAAHFCSRQCYAKDRKPQKASAAKPLRVSANWIMYSHQPPAESGVKASVELVDLITERDFVLIPVNRPDLAVELVSCAELYTCSYSSDRDDRMRGMQASRVIARAKKWMQEISHS